MPGWQEVPAALQVEFGRIIAAVPEDKRAGLLQQVGPHNVASFVRVFHEQTAGMCAAAAAK
jgi:hypothetical protein